MNGRTNAKNGAGAIRDGCAVLEVKAPAQSQITAIRADGLTKRQSKGYVDLNDSEYWFYYIIIQKFELSNLEWTVTATDGTNITSKSVKIATEGQSKNIVLAYPNYLFTSGEGAKTELFKTGYSPETTVLVTDEKIELIGNSSYGGRAIYSNDKIDLTKYSKLCVDGEIYSVTGTIPEYVGISSTRPSTSSQPSDSEGSGKNHRIAYQEMATERSLTYLDISSYSGLYYVLIGGMNKAYIYNWWLE